MKSLKFALALIPLALVGGYFTGSYAYASYTPEVQQQLMEQLGSSQLLMLTAAVQSAVLAFICGLLGCMLANRVGLMKPVRFERAPVTCCSFLPFRLDSSFSTLSAASAICWTVFSPEDCRPQHPSAQGWTARQTCCSSLRQR